MRIMRVVKTTHPEKGGGPVFLMRFKTQSPEYRFNMR